VLTGRLSLDEGIQGTSIDGLSLLSRGVPPPNPAELLGSRKMKDVLNELRQRFEFILIDSTPVIAISDAAVLSILTDGVLLIFDAHRTSTASAQKAVEYLDTVRARFLGVILNAVNLNNPDYSYYRTYSQYYHSNGNQKHHDESVKDSDDTVTMHNGGETNNGLKANRPNDDDSKDQANGAKAAQNRENDDATLSTGESIRESNEEAGFKSAHPSPRAAAEIGLSRPDKPGEVSQAFLGRLIGVFIEAVGPFGPWIVREQISALGESQDAFPRSRIDELVKAIEPEIFDPEMKLRFRERLLDELRKLDSL